VNMVKKSLVPITVRCLNKLTISHEYVLLRSVLLISNIFESLIIYEIMKPVFLLLVFRLKYVSIYRRFRVSYMHHPPHYSLYYHPCNMSMW